MLIMDLSVDNIYKDLEELADPDLQKIRWAAGGTSSYEKLMERLLDEHRLEDFIRLAVDSLLISKDTARQLSYVQYLLDLYQERGHDHAILHDPVWVGVTREVRKALDCWNLDMSR